MTQRPAARIHRATPRTIALLARKLRAGDVVAVPTETVWGLAANALDAGAVEKIFRAKDRPHHDPPIIHVGSLADAEVLGEFNDSARKLAAAFWPGPLTMVLPKRPIVSDLVTAGQRSVAIRMPAHPIFRRLLAAARVPLAAPSANPFGYVSPTRAEHVLDGLGQRIRHILDGGAARVGLESTIVDLRDERHPRILRPGAITRSQLKKVLRRAIGAPARRGTPKSRAQIAPGMLARHYSPHTPVTLHAKLGEPIPVDEAFVYRRRPAAARGPNVFWLDPRGSLAGAARTLFALLRQLDAMGWKKIHVERVTGGELADAINDRLRRAASR
jgi:L-threonylcarbamoyladenylate synthase